MTDDTQQNGHLSTEWLTQLFADLLDKKHTDDGDVYLYLDSQCHASPRVESATANGDLISLEISYFPPLGEGVQRRSEHRELRLSPVLLRDEEPAENEAGDVDEPEKAVA